MAPLGLSTKEFLDKAGSFEIFFSLLLVFLAVTADASWYLLFGNLCCFCGNILWVYTLGIYPGNDNVRVVFCVLVVVNFFGTALMAKKCYRNPPPLFEDSDDEDEAPKQETKAVKGKSRKKKQLKAE